MRKINQKEMTARNKNIPALRFKGFDGEWVKDYFGNIVDMVDSLHITPGEYVTTGYPMIRVTDVNDSILNLEKCLCVSEEVFDEFTRKHRPKLGDIIMSRVGTCGACIRLETNDKVCLGQNTVLLRPKFNSPFLLALIRSRKIQNQVDRKVVGSTQKTLSLKDLKKFLVIIPSLPEQQKIASFLSAIDEKIRKLTRKKELLEQYKKGAMQQLFSGKLRFKDEKGKAYPKWEEIKLKELTEPITKGTTPKRFDKTGVTFVKIEGLNGVNIDKSKCLYISRETHLNELKRSILKENDILFAIAGSVGKVGIVTSDILPANTNQAFAIIRLKDKRGLFFLLQILNSKSMKSYINQNMSVGAQPNLNLEQIGNFKFMLPNIIEQQRIATFLSSIDTKIEVVNNQITKTQIFKKGLLQQMFV